MIFIAGVLFACESPKKKELKEVKVPKIEKTEKTTLGATRFEELNGYFVENDVGFDRDVEFVAVSSLDEFNKYFGTAKTMNNEVTPPDFDKFNVAAIMVKPSKKPGKIKLTKYISEGAKTIVGFEILPGIELNFTSGGLLLFEIPKSRTNVDFISNKDTINVPVK